MDRPQKTGYCRGMPYTKANHLAYLLVEPALFETREERQLKNQSLCCAACGHPATLVAEKIEVFGRHDHAFPLYNEIVELGCFRNAPGCTGVRDVSYGYSWFRGYAWQIQVCSQCYTQLGWKYISAEERFYGLMFSSLKDEDIDPSEIDSDPDRA